MPHLQQEVSDTCKLEAAYAFAPRRKTFPVQLLRSQVSQFFNRKGYIILATTIKFCRYLTKLFFLSRFAQKINLKKHVQASHMSENGHPCPHCNMKFRARDDVANHILKQHVGQALANISQRSQPSQVHLIV